MPKSKEVRILTVCWLLVLVAGTWGVAQENTKPGSPPVAVEAVIQKALINDVKATVDQREIVAENLEADKERQELYEKFQKLLTGAKLTGQFTVDGKPMSNLSNETYEISKVKKLPEGDKWEITARIVYGNKDYEMPVPIDVKWAGTTPVLVLENMWTPAGTFGARVVFHKDKYAGTWSHDEVGGHMFGKISFADEVKNEN